MLHTKFQAPEPSVSKEEDVLIFFNVFYGSRPGPSRFGPF